MTWNKIIDFILLFHLRSFLIMNSWKERGKLHAINGLYSCLWTLWDCQYFCQWLLITCGLILIHIITTQGHNQKMNNPQNNCALLLMTSLSWFPFQAVYEPLFSLRLQRLLGVNLSNYYDETGSMDCADATLNEYRVSLLAEALSSNALMVLET